MEINDKIIKELFSVADLEVPKDVSEADILSALMNIKNAKLQATQSTETNSDITVPTEKTEDKNPAPVVNTPTNKVLVVDDIGVVTYQLKVLFTEIGYNVQIAKDIFGALSTFLKAKFDFVIMDLFVSTEQEGYTLLEETKKIITKNNLPTKIIVITASSKTENKIKCLNGGADIFIKKELGWQDKLLEIIESHRFGN